MPIVKIEPTDEFPVPYDTSDQKPDTFEEELAVAGNTAELQVELGAPLDIKTDDLERTRVLLEAAVKSRKTEPLQKINTAFAAAAFLRTYGQHLAFDAAQARAAITAKLMELANCGEAKYELKALELLGKHSDIGLFTERSEITINYKNPDDLEKAIKERVKRLLNADIIDQKPVGMDLDEELGVFDAGIISKPSLLDELNDDPDEE